VTHGVDRRTAEDRREYNHDYYLRNRDRIRAKYEEDREARLEYARKRRKIYHQRLKQAVLDAYGNCCACCGESDPGFLSVDHVNGGGRAHRKAIGGTVMLWLDIARRGFPPDFQLLCFNCNLGRALNGSICPHKTSSAA